MDLIYDRDLGIFSRKDGSEPVNYNGSHPVICLKGKKYYARRLAWIYVHGSIPAGHVIVHIEGDKYDLCIHNLRAVTKQEAARLRKAPFNTHGVTGVTWSKASNKWLARIASNGKKYNLGFYEEFVDAVRARVFMERSFGWPPNSLGEQFLKIYRP